MVSASESTHESQQERVGILLDGFFAQPNVTGFPFRRYTKRFFPFQIHSTTSQFKD